MTKLAAESLPQPFCPLGYPRYQIEEILGNKSPKFWAWFSGQTGTICDGKKYDHMAKTYRPTECVGNEHGPVVYPWDLKEFVRYNGRVTTD